MTRLRSNPQNRAQPGALFGQSLLALALAAMLIAGCPMSTTPPANDGPPTPDDSSDQPQARLPFASPCAQFAGLCTSSFPTAVFTVVAGDGQTVTETTDPVGFIVQGSDGNGSEVVMLQGSASRRDNADPHVAESIDHSWSANATDDDPCTLTPGAEFSTDPDTQITLDAGVHYIRLTVRNNVPLVQESLPQQILDQCDGLAEAFKCDMLEVVVEVRD